MLDVMICKNASLCCSHFLHSYFSTLCGSTIFQSYLLRLGISNSAAFWSTIALGSIVNYVVLTSLNSMGDGAPSHRHKSHDSKKDGRLEIALIQFDHRGQREIIAELSGRCVVSAHRAFKQIFPLSRNSCR